MNMLQIKSIARTNGINPGKSGKVTLIRSIQRHEGNFDCFATATQGMCDQSTCMWRSDCFDLSSKQNGKSNGKNNGVRKAIR